MIREVLFAVSFGLAGCGAGWFFGAAVGGNVAPGFSFAGTRGYEATGLIGAIAGALAGMILGSRLGKK